METIYKATEPMNGEFYRQFNKSIRNTINEEGLIMVVPSKFKSKLQSSLNYGKFLKEIELAGIQEVCICKEVEEVYRL